LRKRVKARKFPLLREKKVRAIKFPSPLGERVRVRGNKGKEERNEKF